MPKIDKVKINVKERVDDNTVDLSLSELTEVPIKDIAAHKRVVNVDLSNNKIATLGKNISLLSHITKLDLSKNDLRFLPDDFGTLKNLRHLDLYNNRLEHLPLSFGNLQNLRYLDLKANPLAPSLAKIVGLCLTTKDCSDSARNTVKFLKLMQTEYDKAKQKQHAAALQQQLLEEAEAALRNAEILKAKKKKTKSKSKKNKIHQNGFDTNHLNNKDTKNHIDRIDYSNKRNNSKTALKTVFVFFFLLAINIFIIYILTVKNPEIGEKIAEMIPEKYRNVFLTKTADMKLNFLRISDWLQQFRTPAEDFPHFMGHS